MLPYLKKLQKRLRKSSFFLLLVLIFSLELPQAKAAFLEPYLGHVRYDLTQERSNSQDASVISYKAKGQRWGGGLRYWPSFRPFFFGIDLSYYPLKRLDSFSSATTNETLFFFGPTLGYEMSLVPLRLWLTFNYIDRFRYESAKMFSGMSLKAGLGVYILPSVSFNFELARHVYSRDEEKSGVTHLPVEEGGKSYQKPEMTSVFLSLSFPFW